MRSGRGPTLFPYTTLFRSLAVGLMGAQDKDKEKGKHEGMEKKEMAGGNDAIKSAVSGRSEEHTSELQSRFELVCRLLLEKKNERSRRTAERRPHGLPQTRP